MGVGVSLRPRPAGRSGRSEEHTSELQSRLHLVCRLLLEKKNIQSCGTELLYRRELRVSESLWHATAHLGAVLPPMSSGQMVHDPGIDKPYISAFLARLTP